MVTKLPERASHPLKNCDLHFFPNWQAFPGVRESSDTRKTRTILPLDFSWSPQSSLLQTPFEHFCTVVTRQRGEKGHWGPCSIRVGPLPGIRTLIPACLPLSLQPLTMQMKSLADNKG